MKIKINNSNSANVEINENEKKYVTSYLGHIDTFNNLTIHHIFMIKFLKAASSKDENILLKKEKLELVQKIFDAFKQDDDVFISLIMPNISNLFLVVNSSALKKSADKLIMFAADLLKKNENERKLFIENILDLYTLCHFNLNHSTLLVKSLIEVGDLNRLLEDNDDLCTLGELFPQLSNVIIEEVLSDVELCDRLINSQEQLIENQKIFSQMKENQLKKYQELHTPTFSTEKFDNSLKYENNADRNFDAPDSQALDFEEENILLGIPPTTKACSASALISKSIFPGNNFSHNNSEPVLSPGNFLPTN